MHRTGIKPIPDSAALGVPARLSGTLPRRSARVVALVGIILALSLADLVLTLTYVLHVGLIEDNPLARRVIEAGGPALLIVWKLGSVAFAAAVMLRYRARGVAELGAVLCATVMVWLTARWVQYIEMAPELTPALADMDRLGGGNWVTLAEVEPKAP